MRLKLETPIVLFNASVILAGLKFPSGGAGKLLIWVRQKRIIGVVSEIVLDEVIRNASKIDRNENWVQKEITKTFTVIWPSPKERNVAAFKRIVVDYGDAHLLASSGETNAHFLVTLDKKHLLVLQKKIKGVKIVSPGQLIERFSPERGSN